MQDSTRTFAALGDPVRRAIVELLADGDATVNEIGVVSRRKVAQTRPVHLEADALALPADWLAAYRQRLDQRYARLDRLLDETKEGT